MDTAFIVIRRDGETVLGIDGEVDLANARALQTAIESLATRPGDGRVVLDLRALTFIDSTGLHAIVSGAKALNRTVVLRDPSGPIRRVLDIALPGYFCIELTDDPGPDSSRAADDRVRIEPVRPEELRSVPFDRRAHLAHDARAEALSALSRFILADTTLGDTLQRVAEITVEAIPAAQIAGMSLLDPKGVPTTAIYTGRDSPEIDQAQYESGEGPCLDAWRTREIVRVDDMDSDGERYPEFAEAARQHHVLSTLSLPLVAGSRGIGALNLYSRRKSAFTADDESLGTELAAAASVVLANAAAYWQVSELNTDLTEAMKSRAVIEQAKGMLMASSVGMDADKAFEVLRQASQRENVKLRVIAQRIVDREMSLQPE